MIELETLLIERLPRPEPDPGFVSDLFAALADDLDPDEFLLVFDERRGRYVGRVVVGAAALAVSAAVGAVGWWRIRTARGERAA